MLTDITVVNKTSHGIFFDNVIFYIFTESTNTVRSYLTDDCSWTLRYVHTINATAETITSYESVRHVHAHHPVAAVLAAKLSGFCAFVTDTN